MRASRLLLAAAVVCYVLYDIVSTLVAYDYLGTFEYEKSFLIKAAFQLAGVPGFISVKLVVSTIAILAAYLLMERFERFRRFGAGILAGATAAGLFVGTSNLNIVLNGNSIWLLGLDSGTVAAVIIAACAFAGLLASGRHETAPATRAG